jgi:RNA polymerase sigma factor (sigma-70 family)
MRDREGPKLYKVGGPELKSDSQIIREVKDGKVESYSELITRYEKKIYGFILHILRPYHLESMAEDLCQETFYKAFKNLKTFRDDDAAFSTWLYTIARNTVLSELRKSKNSEIYMEDASPLFLSSPAPLPEQELLRNETEGLVRSAINQLPESQRSAIILREYEDMDYKEIASILGLTVSSVKSLLFRARQSIRLQLEPYISDSRMESGRT